jgi:hypothetical protein
MTRSNGSGKNSQQVIKTGKTGSRTNYSVIPSSAQFPIQLVLKMVKAVEALNWKCHVPCAAEVQNRFVYQLRCYISRIFSCIGA